MEHNRLVLIGNGFDLALGLKTTYTDFILDYIRKCVSSCFTKRGPYSDKMIMIKNTSGHFPAPAELWLKDLNKIVSIDELLIAVKKVFEIEFKNHFLKEIINEVRANNWIDIEAFYYSSLQSIFKRQTQLHLRDGREKNFKQVMMLNDCMSYITAALDEYILEQQELATIDYDSSHMAGLIDQLFKPLSNKDTEILIPYRKNNETKKVMVLNFNYTNTAQKLLNNSSVPKSSHIHIHGTVNDKDNSIIFGYGDDTGDEYSEIEMEGNDELLRKIKSFQYPRTYNYHHFLNFINYYKFDVFIVGHSCGLSDKTMLKTIFEHDNCIGIKNFHYKEDDNEASDEEFDKRMAISRHFSNKKLMRDRVLPFDMWATIPQKQNS